jgi:hypothetical protein
MSDQIKPTDEPDAQPSGPPVNPFPPPPPPQPAASVDAPVPPYQQRVLDEKAALDEKIDKLDIFRAGTIFPTLPTDEQNRLNLQLSFMRSYSGVLTDRINAWTVDGAPQPATGAGEEQA